MIFYNKVWNKIERSIKQRGVFGSFSYMARIQRTRIINRIREIKNLHARKKEITLDQKYGIDTTERVEKEAMQADSTNLKYSLHYEASLWMDFGKILAPFDLAYENMTFIDLGTGKGRPVLMAASLPFNSVVGVEFSEKLAEIARENIKKFPKKKIQSKHIDIVCLDAVKYDFPKGGLVIYFYNPFEEPVMERVIENLRKAYETENRPILVLYKLPVYGHLLKKENFLHLMKEHVFEEYRTTPDITLEIYATEHFRTSKKI